MAATQRRYRARDSRHLEKRAAGVRARKRKKDLSGKNIRFKLTFVKWVMIFMVVFLSNQILRLKKINGEDYENRAIVQQINSVSEKTINPNRGSILDRNKQSLAISSTVYNVVLDVRVMLSDDVAVPKKDGVDSKKDVALKALNETLGIPMETLNEYLAVDSNTGAPVNDTNWKIIAREVDHKLADELKKKNLAAVHFVEDTARTYIHSNLASQMIGFRTGDKYWGLESYYDNYMRGTSGRMHRIYDQSGSPTTELYPAVRGDTVITTIDLTIQQFADEICTKWGNDLQADNVEIIVMDPYTGEIHAMAEYPSFNLNDPKDISSISNENKKAEWSELSEEEWQEELYKIWKNYGITDTFEPGSIFKPIVIAAALDEGVVSLDDTFYCSGVKVFAGNVPITCHLTSGHGMQTLDQAVANSCNVVLMNIAAEMGKETFYKYQRDFGFAELTGIDLPSESNAAPLVYSLSDLTIDSQLGSSSIGQGFNCTAIQALTAFAAVINGGNLLKPYVVSQIIDANGNVTLENSTTVHRKVISRETSDYLRVEMEKVISQGTGKKAQIPGYSIGGKTGTGQQGAERKDYVLSFIGYLPVEDPQYIAIIAVNRPYVPDSQSIPSISPMLQELFQKIITYKSIPQSYSKDEINSSDSGAALMPDFVGQPIESVTRSINSMGVEYELVGGKGAVVQSQFPPADAEVNSQTKVILYISAESSDELIAVPNLIGMTYSDAVQLLADLGFNSAGAPDNPESEFGIVSEQIPEAGIQLTEGSYIRIKVEQDTAEPEAPL